MDDSTPYSAVPIPQINFQTSAPTAISPTTAAPTPSTPSTVPASTAFAANLAKYGLTSIPAGYAFNADGTLVNGSGQAYVAKPAVTPIGSPVTSPTGSTATATPPTIPTPTAPAVQSSYVAGTQANLDSSNAALTAAYTSAQAALTAKASTIQSQIDSITANQNNDQTAEAALSAPFQQMLIATMDQQYNVQANFQANQQLASQLQSLLSQGQALITMQQGQAVSSAILTKTVSQTISEISAQAGVIQATMAAYNNQIDEANKIIDQAVTAAQADRNDQLNYYQSLDSYYATTKADDGSQLVTLTKDQQDYVTSQISDLQTQVSAAQKNADSIKAAMQDPTTALAYAQAGVSLNDDPATINSKLATYAYSSELSATANDMASKGYNAVLPGQTAPPGSTVVTTTDTKGVNKQWYTTTKSTSTTADLVQQKQQDTAQMAQVLESRVGTDGYLSPQDYATGKNAWIAAGYAPADYDTEFASLRNPTDTYNTQ